MTHATDQADSPLLSAGHARATDQADSPLLSAGHARRWVCLLGQPVAHSLSPALHNAAFASLGIDAHYEAWEVAPHGLGEAVARLRAADCMGANVTAPHKQAVVAFMDEVSDEVLALGVLNTIVNQRGRLVGGNTDARGLARWMRQARIDPAGRPALVLGAGGAARAAVWALADLQASTVLVLNRTVERAQDVVVSLQPFLDRSELCWGPLDQVSRPVPAAWHVVINATSLGHHGGAPDLHPSCYSPGSVAIELAYNPPETGFMVAARLAGARAENGLGMLLHQAALAFERWTGQDAPMRAYEDVIRQGQRR
ncbi:MAG TPA: shikimate dehydrogenase [Chloroflexota bacterium]|nr:shikimate dehydrogenase [Chloroflexota bacterium]